MEPSDGAARRRGGERPVSGPAQPRAQRIGLLLAAVGIVVVGVTAAVHGLDGKGSPDGAPRGAAASAGAGGRAEEPGGGRAPGARAERSTSGPRGAASSTTSAAADPGEPVTFAFGGDIHFEGMLRSQLDANPSGVLAPVAPVLSAADVAVVNLETAVTEGGTPGPKEYTFRAPATAFTALQAAGVDVASMANNHGMDYGVDGLRESLAASDAAGLPVVGIGLDEAQAYRPWTTEVKGQRIAVIGATQVLDSSLIDAWTAQPGQPGLASAKRVDALSAAVRRAADEHDIVVVFLHWGVEKQTCPSGDQQGLAQALVDAGADIVVGGHAHRLQGAGRLGEAVVGYGLGNFVFYTPSGPGTESGVLLVTARRGVVDRYEWVPAQLRNGVATPLDGDAAAAARSSWDSLRGCTGLAP